MCSFIFPMHTQSQKNQPQTVDHFVAPNRLPKASHRKHLTLTCAIVPPKRLQNHHSLWLCSHNIRAESISFINGTSKERSWQVPDPAKEKSASYHQHLHSSSYTVVRVDYDSQQACGLAPHMNGPIAHSITTGQPT